jgi:hypothetical protein
MVGVAPEAAELYRAVESMRQAYNYDGSDTMTDYFDVNYYGSTTFESECERNRRLAKRTKAAA